VTSMRRSVARGTGRKVISQARARQLAALAYDTAADWYQRGWMSEAEWQGYQAAYSRGIDGGPSEPGAWVLMQPEVEAIAGAITRSIGIRNGRLFDERGMDDPAPWADYGAGSLTKQELLALRKQLQVGYKLRLAAVGRDASDATACELDELFDDLLYEQAAWLEPHAAAVTEAVGAACPSLRPSARRGKVAAASADSPGRRTCWGLVLPRGGRRDRVLRPRRRQTSASGRDARGGTDPPRPRLRSGTHDPRASTAGGHSGDHGPGSCCAQGAAVPPFARR
jgi:hypothetical protein